MSQTNKAYRIIRPSIGTYFIFLNISPIICIASLYASSIDHDIDALFIGISIILYMVFIILILKNNYILVDGNSITIKYLLKKSIIIPLTKDAVDIKKQYFLSSLPNRVKITICTNLNEKHIVMIHTKWYSKSDISYLMSRLKQY